MNVQVVHDRDATASGDDFLRVYCQRRPGLPQSFATIERVFGGAIRTSTWSFRTLVDATPMTAEVATSLAEAYAERKNIPVIYVEVE
jgi:hypothetical protein